MKLRVHFTALYFIVVSSLTAQEGSSLLTLIHSIEEEHETTLNYDPDLIAKYEVKSIDKTTDLESALQAALLGTDLEHLHD